MKRVELNGCTLMVLDHKTSCRISGGSQGWDYEIAEAIGVAVGYSVKKLWNLFMSYSRNLTQMQANTQVIYK